MPLAVTPPAIRKSGTGCRVIPAKLVPQQELALVCGSGLPFVCRVRREKALTVSLQAVDIRTGRGSGLAPRAQREPGPQDAPGPGSPGAVVV